MVTFSPPVFRLNESSSQKDGKPRGQPLADGRPLYASMKALPTRKGNFGGGCAVGGGVGASMKALPKRKGNAEAD